MLMNTATGALWFGAFAVGIEVLVMLLRKRGWGAESTRLVGLTIIVVLGVYLVASDVPVERLSPAIGLLSIIGGYYIGKTGKADEPN